MSSRVVRSGGRSWAQLSPQPYKPEAGSFCEVMRLPILGGPAGDPLAFEIRYFEVAPGGWTSFERHRHPHAVVVIAGRGEVRLGETRHALEPFDAVYVAPGEPHQFFGAAEEKLGFLCVVDRERDRPEPLGDDLGAGS